MASVKQAVKLLNEALDLNPTAVNKLFKYYVSCTHKLEDHPTIQVKIKKGKPYVGVLGLLNGIFGAHKNGIGKIMIYTDKGEIMRFSEVDYKQSLKFLRGDTKVQAIPRVVKS